MRFVTGFVGAVSEAWTELRIHRVRVLLSLIGISISICALTIVAALGGMLEQSQRESYERSSGRPAMLMVSSWQASGEGDSALVDAAFHDAMERYRVTYASRIQYGDQLVQFPHGVSGASVIGVDPDYGIMHRVALADGRWFTERDELRLAPAIIINEYMWQQLGSPPMSSHPTVTIAADRPTTAVIVGVTPSPVWDTYPQAFMLLSAVTGLRASGEQHVSGSTQYEAWVPPELAAELMPLIAADMRGSLGDAWRVDVGRNDYLAWGAYDPLEPTKLVIGGVAIFILLLGALGLLTISLVTVRYRIREIGIRRSFGASGGRIFFSVMMESVVATVVAGFVGVVIAVLLSRLDLVREYVLQGAQDTPPFPWEAAVTGLVAAAVVGALAGLLPALIAVRVKVIDAIRI